MFVASRRKPAQTKSRDAPESVSSNLLTSGRAQINPLWRRLATRVQAKLTAPAIDDPYEREADRLAERALRMPDPSSNRSQLAVSAFPAGQAQRKCAGCEEEEQGKLRRKGDGANSESAAFAPATVNQILNSPCLPLAQDTRAFFEPRFGRDFGAVRVHTGPHADALARSVNALAFTLGRDVVFRAGQYAPHSEPGRRLLAHELAHVAQQSGGAPRLQRQPADEEEPPKMAVSGDSVRKSPSGGVAISNGALEWELKFTGKDNELTTNDAGELVMTLGSDVAFKASFTPASGSSTCPTITFIQTVIPTTGGVWDTGPLLYTRSPASGASVDALHGESRPETEPFYGADPSASGPGLAATPTRTIAGTRAGASSKASLDDAPFLRHVPKGATAIRQFESAVVCVETAESFGSITWGYTKTGSGVVTLLGGTQKDVRISGASASFEPTRAAFYSGFFQHSLGGFAVGSAALTAAHKAALDAIDTRNLTRVILVGANDNSGGPEAKPELSLKRAKAVEDYLLKTRGVSGSLVRVEGHGVEARVPNPPGKEAPANRRVDVHIQRGAEAPKPGRVALGSSAERKRLQGQNPRLTMREAVETIVRLDSTTGRVSMAEWVELLEMLNALDDWRRIDPTVPDLRQIYREPLSRIKGRSDFGAPKGRAPLPPTGPISPEVDEALRKYEEAKRRLKELKRERGEAERRLREEFEELEEEP